MRRILERGEAVIDAVARVFAVLAGVCIATIMAAVTYDVASRQLGGRGLRGMVEYGEVLMVFVVFLSLAYAQMVKSHIGIELLVERLPAAVSARLDIVVLTAMAALLIWMTVQTGIAALDSYQRSEYRFGLVAVPVWPARLMIPLGLGAMGLQCLAQALRGVATLRAGRTPDPERAAVPAPAV